MFDSKAVLWEKGAPLATVWIAANLGKCKSFRVKLTRRDYCRTDIVEVCSALMTPQVKLTLRLTSHLLLGIVRIHSKQIHYALRESESLLKHFDFISKKFTIDLTDKPRYAAVTLPDVAFDMSFSSLCDMSLSDIETLSGYFKLNSSSTVLQSRQNPSSSSSSSSPSPSDLAALHQQSPPFTADPKDISIVEQPNETHMLEDSLWDAMYFGDEDPVLLADKRKTLASNLPSSPQEDDRPHLSETHPPNSPPPQDGNKSDPVLLFNEESGSFEYSSASGEGKDSLNESGQRNGNDDAGKAAVTPEGESPPPHIPASPFEIPYLATPKITPTPTDFACIEDEHADGVCPRKRKRAKRKLQVLDLETEIESQMFRNGLNDKSVGLREQSFTKQFTKISKATDLLNQPFSKPVRNHILASKSTDCLSLSPEELAANMIPEFELSDVTKGTQHAATPSASKLRLTPMSTPMIAREELQRMQLDISAIPKREESERMSMLETEVLRRAGDGDHVISYEDPLRSASNSQISVDSLNSRLGGVSFQTSTTSRLNSDVFGGERRPALPLVMGALSPILDVEEEMEITPVELPMIDDSDVIIAGSFSVPQPPQSKTTPSSSPYIESKPSAYCSHVVSVMGGRTEMEFQELLPTGTTRRTASRAFSHVLTLVSNYKFLSVEQATPYGPITLQRGERF